MFRPTATTAPLAADVRVISHIRPHKMFGQQAMFNKAEKALLRRLRAKTNGLSRVTSDVAFATCLSPRLIAVFHNFGRWASALLISNDSITHLLTLQPSDIPIPRRLWGYNSIETGVVPADQLPYREILQYILR